MTTKKKKKEKINNFKKFLEKQPLREKMEWRMLFMDMRKYLNKNN